MKLVSVVLDIPTQALDSTFTYVVVESEEDRARLSQASVQDSHEKHRKAEHIQESLFQESFVQESFLPEEGAPSGKDRSADDSLTDGHKAADDSLADSHKTDTDAHDFALEVGCAVLVPFGHRSAVGFVVEITPLGVHDPFPARDKTS